MIKLKTAIILAIIALILAALMPAVVQGQAADTNYPSRAPGLQPQGDQGYGLGCPGCPGCPDSPNRAPGEPGCY